MENIRSYYKICGVKSPDDQINPVFNQLEKDIISSLLGATDTYLTTQDNIKTFNETIIGGAKSGKNKKSKHLMNQAENPEGKATEEPIAYPTTTMLYKPLKFKMVKLLFLIPKEN